MKVDTDILLEALEQHSATQAPAPEKKEASPEARWPRKGLGNHVHTS